MTKRQELRKGNVERRTTLEIKNEAEICKLGRLCHAIRKAKVQN